MALSFLRLAQRLFLLLAVVVALTTMGASATPVPEADVAGARAPVNVESTEAVTALEERGSVEKRSFLESCINFSIAHQVLHGDCRKNDGSWQHTTQILDACVSNLNGALWWANNGIFSFSCRNIGLRWVWWDDAAVGELWLTAECRNSGGGYTYSELYLNARIHNWDGSFACQP